MAGTGEKQNPSGAAAESIGCRGRNHRVLREKPVVAVGETDGFRRGTHRKPCKADHCL